MDVVKKKSLVLSEYVLGQISKSSCLTRAEEQEIKKKLSNFVSRLTTKRENLQLQQNNF